MARLDFHGSPDMGVAVTVRCGWADNKMEVISRRAYGFRNFKNYRLRVMALCG